MRPRWLKLVSDRIQNYYENTRRQFGRSTRSHLGILSNNTPPKLPSLAMMLGSTIERKTGRKTIQVIPGKNVRERKLFLIYRNLSNFEEATVPNESLQSCPKGLRTALPLCSILRRANSLASSSVRKQDCSSIRILYLRKGSRPKR